jgi:hypothetical protein
MHSILNGVSQLTQSIRESNIRKIFVSGSRYVPRKKFTWLFILRKIYLFKNSVSIFDNVLKAECQIQLLELWSWKEERNFRHYSIACLEGLRIITKNIKVARVPSNAQQVTLHSPEIKTELLLFETSRRMDHLSHSIWRPPFAEFWVSVISLCEDNFLNGMRQFCRVFWSSTLRNLIFSRCLRY